MKRNTGTNCGKTAETKDIFFFCNGVKKRDYLDWQETFQN